jgi:Cyanophycinase and related exopeptidases
MRFQFWLLSLALTYLTALETAVSAVKAADSAAALVGTWETIDRHIAMGSLYQPVHGVRKREGVVHFRLEGDRLIGWAIHADHQAITHQERWKDGRTDFRKVSFADGRVVFEWDIGQWLPTAGPIAVEQGRQENKGSIRVEASLNGNRLVGTWKMFLADGAEVFRGEWEAVRAKSSPYANGSLMLIGGRHQDLTNELREEFFKLAGGNKAKIVVIPTAVADTETDQTERFRQPWLDLGAQSVEVLHTRDRKTADDPNFVKPLREATAVFFTNGHRHRIFDAYRETLVEKELQQLQARGGLIGGTGTGAAVLSEVLIKRPEDGALTEPGLGLAPGLLIEDRSDGDGFAEVVAANPGQIGILIEPGAAVVIRDNHMRVMGDGAVTIRLAKGAGQEAKVLPLMKGHDLDLNELLREAAARVAK